MSDHPATTTPDQRPGAKSGAALLTFGGLAAAFGLASCCALPLLLTTLGLGTAWLSGIALIASYRRFLVTA
jgi:mercuric ion transport protein